jgi:putative CocE/NonD family hydrolase
MNVPAVIVASWFDFMSAGGVEAFIGRQHQGGSAARGRQKLIVGPWVHGSNTKNTNKVGDLEFPANARFDMDADMIRWFDGFLKPNAAAADKRPAVRYYVMGAAGEPDAPGNAWREAADWPLKSQPVSFYLRSGARLSQQQPDAAGGSTEFQSDPKNPAPMPGRLYPAAQNDRKYEQHPDVRVFTTEPLTQPVEWTGKVEAELFVSSSARDTDFIVRVNDVYPDGRSIMLIDSIRRARYRDGFERQSLLTPGKIYRVRFDVGWLSQIFNRGHRIRIVVASTGADFYEPNPQTGEPLTIGPPAKTEVARNTVYHDRQHASRIIAPVLLVGQAFARNLPN